MQRARFSKSSTPAPALVPVIALLAIAGSGHTREVVASSAQVPGPPAVAPGPNSCLAGTGSRNWCGDGGPATQAKLAGPGDVTTAPDGTLFIADTLNNVIRRVTTEGIIETVAGDGVLDAPKATEPAATASFDQPRGVAFEPAGSLLVADTNHDAIRRVAADGLVTTVVGGPDRVLTQLRRPGDVVALATGGMLVVDTGNHRVLLVSATGSVRRVAGTGRAGFTRSQRPGSRSPLRSPAQVAPLARGDMLIADTGNRAIRWLRRGRLRTLAVLRPRRSPRGVAAAGGRVLASHDTGVQDVTRSGDQFQVAGTGRRGFTGDTGPATRVALDLPRQLATAPDGTLLIAEERSDRIRRVRVGEIVTVAGTDTPLATLASRRVRAGRASSIAACYQRNPRFQVFAFLPQSSPQLRATPRRLKLRITTSREARVKLRLSFKGDVKRRKTLERVGNSAPRKVVFRGRLRVSNRYSLAMEGRSLTDGIVRCDRRGVTVR